MNAYRHLAWLWLLLGFNAVAVNPDLFQDLHWRSIGPFRGGRVLAVSGIAGDPQHFYFGAVNGGVWETKDGARTWQPIFDDQPTGAIGALALAPSNPQVLYVGSGEADMRSDISQGNGLYKSTDAGKSWSSIGLNDTQQIGRVLVHPNNPDLVYVAALGHPYGPNEQRGVFRSSDGGKTWQKILYKNANTGAIDLAFEPGNPKVVYAALWQTRRTPWNIYPPSSGPGSGLYKSTDGGDHWTFIGGHGLPMKHGRIGLAVALTAPQRVYAMVDSEAGGLYRSDDGGAHWTLTGSDRRIWNRGWYFSGISVDPKNADVIYACNTNLYRSNDGGKTFVPTKGAPGGDDYHELWIDPTNPERQILGVDQGAVVTQNGGETWSSWYNQPTGQFYHVSTDTRFPYWVYGSQQDSGAASVPSRSNNIDGINMTQFRETTAGGESDNIAPDPKDSDVIYGGRVRKLNLRSQQTEDIDPTFAYPDHYRSVWTLPLVFSYRNPDVLYFSNQRLFRTADNGKHWDIISPDLTRENPEVPRNLDPPTIANNEQRGARRGVIYAIAPSRLNEHDIWLGTDDGLVWRTRDEGAHWDNITPAQLSSWSKVGNIETSHFDAQRAYIAIDRHRLDDFKPYVYRTQDGGKNWQPIATGIPDGKFVNVIREDSARPGLLYAGTEKGVFVSFDDGSHWQPLQNGLPVTSVRDIDVHDNDLVIATHGRAFWILDDITALRQIDAAVETSPAWLFAPATTIRLRPAGFVGTPLPKDEPMAPNPADGAYIDYVLHEPITTPITLTILTEHGELVRRYNSTEQPPKIDTGTIETAPDWINSPVKLATTPGMHRFVWSLHYPAPKALSGGNPYADGVWAPPGRYKAELSVADKRYTQTFSVLPDPRIDLPQQAYAQQFELAQKIETARERAVAAATEAEQLAKLLIERAQSQKPDSKIAAYLGAVQQRLVVLSGNQNAAYPNSTWYLPPKSLTSLRYLTTELEKLADAVDGADAWPTTDAQTGYVKIQPLLNTTLTLWDRFKAHDLATLNKRLEKAAINPVSLSIEQ